MDVSSNPAPSTYSSGSLHATQQTSDHLLITSCAPCMALKAPPSAALTSHNLHSAYPLAASQICPFPASMPLLMPSCSSPSPSTSQKPTYLSQPNSPVTSTMTVSLDLTWPVREPLAAQNHLNSLKLDKNENSVPRCISHIPSVQELMWLRGLPAEGTDFRTFLSLRNTDSAALALTLTIPHLKVTLSSLLPHTPRAPCNPLLAPADLCLD